MGRLPSEGTRLKNAEREVRRLSKELSTCEGEKRYYRQMMEKAHAEVNEWKHRFDALLERSPSTSSPQRSETP